MTLSPKNARKSPTGIMTSSEAFATPRYSRARLATSPAACRATNFGNIVVEITENRYVERKQSL